MRLQALETPGHTPESISIAVFDLDFDATRPYAVLTGDTLFVGDVGRPDLWASLGWSAADLGAKLYDSLWTKLLTLPELPKDRPLLVHCAGGYRSSIAASLLQQQGYEVSELAGGMAAWEMARLPTQHGA